MLMGLRAKEIVERVVRDVDDDGRLLWIPESKTEAGRRAQEVPAVLKPYLLRLVEGKKPEEEDLRGGAGTAGDGTRDEGAALHAGHGSGDLGARGGRGAGARVGDHDQAELHRTRDGGQQRSAPGGEHPEPSRACL